VRNYERDIIPTANKLEQECRKRGHTCVSNTMEFVINADRKPTSDELKKVQLRVKKLFNHAQGRLGVDNKSSKGMVSNRFTGSPSANW
jgi:hypothetical protein